MKRFGRYLKKLKNGFPIVMSNLAQKGSRVYTRVLISSPNALYQPSKQPWGASNLKFLLLTFDPIIDIPYWRNCFLKLFFCFGDLSWWTSLLWIVGGFGTRRVCVWGCWHWRQVTGDRWPLTFFLSVTLWTLMTVSVLEEEGDL